MEPTEFGRYLLIEELAHGGMGQVYRAVLRSDSGFAKQVALKRVRGPLSRDPDFVARFADEARIASTLSHSNIVQVFDFGEIDGEQFLAMELVDGIDLGRLLRASPGPLPLPAALFIAASFCRGLGVAHRRAAPDGTPRPVVHRDLSPQNVLISRAGEVKVTDFGIAKAADRWTRTRTGMVLGKCRYMAPEQAAGDAVDARADVFSAGAVLLEMLCGGQPIAITWEEMARELATFRGAADDPAPLDAVGALLLAALAHDRSARPADGIALARQLELQLQTVAPRFSRDDLAALVTEAAPPAAAHGGGTAYADTERDPARGDSGDAAARSGCTTVAARPRGGAFRGRGGARPGPARPRRRRWWQAVALALLLGAAGGAIAGHCLHAGAPAPRTAPPRRPVAHGPWRVLLSDVALERSRRPARRRLVVRLQLERDGRPAPPAAGRLFSLHRAGADAPATPPRLWRCGSPWLLSFTAPAGGGELVLRFAPDGTPPLDLRLWR